MTFAAKNSLIKLISFLLNNLPFFRKLVQIGCFIRLEMSNFMLIKIYFVLGLLTSMLCCKWITDGRKL